MTSANDKVLSLSLIICTFCVGMYLVPVQMMHSDLSHIPGNLGDARLNNYFLEHGYKWLSGHEDSFWNAPFFYPTVRSMSYSDNFLGTLPIYAFFRFLKHDRETSYQLWFFAIFTLNYFICAYVLRRLSVNALGAASGAFIFTFSLPVIARIGHSQLLARFMIPIAFYFTIRFLEKPANKPLAYACLAIVIQFYCTMYMGFFLVIGLMLLLISDLMLQEGRVDRFREIIGKNFKTVLTRLIIGFTAILSLLPLIIPYHKTAAELGYRSWPEIAQMLPRISSYFTPPGGSLLWAGLEPIGNTLPMSWEHQIFVGAIPLAALIMTPVLYFKNRSKPLLKKGMTSFITVALLVIITLYLESSHGLSLYKIVMRLPGIRAIRAVTRVILLMLFPLSVVIGVILTRLSEKRIIVKHFPLRVAFSTIVLIALVADQNVKAANYDTYSKKGSQARLMAVEKLVRKKGEAAAVFSYMPVKSSEPEYVVHLDAMLAAQDLDMATVNGYSGNFPSDYDFLYNYDQCGSLEKWKVISAAKYAKGYGSKDLFQNLIVVGRDPCEQNQHTYSFMREALPKDGYHASVSSVVSKIILGRDVSTTLKINLKNESRVSWGALGNEAKNTFKIQMSYRWLSSNRSPLGGFDLRFPLPHDLSPGETSAMEIFVHAPALPGKYYLEFDLVQESVAWFREKGSSPALMEVEVL